MSGRIAMIALVLALALVLAMILIAGWWSVCQSHPAAAVPPWTGHRPVRLRPPGPALPLSGIPG